MTGIIALTGGAFYARSIEPRILVTDTLTIHHSLIPEGFNGLKLLQFSDTHIGFHFTLSDLERLVRKINRLQPDCILFTGDLMDAPNQFESIDKIAPILQTLNAPLGKFAIYGNHDHGGYGTDLYKEVISDAGFKLLQNESVPIKLLSGETIQIAGIDDAMLGRPDLQATMTKLSKGVYTILLSHAPDLANQACDLDSFHLQLSGHSHGGQIQLPWFGALIKPPFAKQYVEGLYTIKSKMAGSLTLYVNRGIGTTRIPVRFMSPPELTMITLQSE